MCYNFVDVNSNRKEELVMVRVGINGFGRIGRLAFRYATTLPDVEVVAINDPFLDLDYMAYMLMYDTTHGRFSGTVGTDGDKLVVNGKKINVFACMDPKDIPCGDVGADYILECTDRKSVV
jgi:glyceraldehyde 3-phosphate dehydrogenase